MSLARLFIFAWRGERCDGSESSASSADKPGRDMLDTRPEGREVVEMKGEGRGPRRHICRHYSPGACRAWEPYLSPPQNSLLPTHPLPFYQCGPSTGLVPPLFGLDGLFSHLFPPPLSYGLLLPNLCLFLPVFLLCCVLWCGFTLALTLPKAKISSLTLPWYIIHSEQKRLCNRNVEVSFYKLNFFYIHSEQKCLCSRNVEEFFSIHKGQADGRLMKHNHTL